MNNINMVGYDQLQSNIKISINIDIFDTWILRMYQKYRDGYFYINIDKAKNNKNILKLIKKIL